MESLYNHIMPKKIKMMKVVYKYVGKIAPRKIEVPSTVCILKFDLGEK
jgi:hypothetical protein